MPALACRMTTMRGSAAAMDARIAGVSSVEPSSTITIRMSATVCAAMLATDSRTVEAALKTGIRTSTAAPAISIACRRAQRPRGSHHSHAICAVASETAPKPSSQLG